MELYANLFNYLEYKGTCIPEPCNILHVATTYYYRCNPSKQFVTPITDLGDICDPLTIKTQPIFAFVGASYPVNAYFVIGASVFSIPFDMYQLYHFSEWCCVISSFSSMINFSFKDFNTTFDFRQNVFVLHKIL